jgi:drug/metabolite transporter (DMT)-like permease
VEATPASANNAPARIGDTRAYLQLFVTICVWGGTFPIARRAVDGADPLALAAGRYLLGAVVLLAIVRASGFRRISRRDLALCAVMGASGVVAFNVLTFAGLEFALAGDAALIMPTMPIAVTIPLAVLLFGERFGRWQVAGLALLLIGEFFVFREAVFSESVDGDRLLGIGMFFAAAGLWGVYTIAARGLSGSMDATHATAVAVWLAAGPLLLLGGVPLAREVAGGVDGDFALALAYMGALQVVVGLIWWFQGVESIGAARAALINALVPVVALVIAGLVLDEVVTVERGLGAALVVAGVAVAAGVNGRGSMA